MKHILIISFSNISRDPRVMRQIWVLTKEYKITVVGFGSKPDADIEFFELHPQKLGLGQKILWAGKLIARQFEWHYWSKPYIQESLQLFANQQFDVVLANDVSALPVALKIAKGCPVLVDAHEYTPKEFEDSWRWRLFFQRYSHYLCQRYLPQAASMTTVCQGIADEYHKEYGIQPSVIHNAPSYQNLSPTTPNKDHIRLIHHGAAIRSRHIEIIIEMMDYLDERFTLDFMLVATDPIYLIELQEKAKDDKRIRFIDPVPMPDICMHINKFDVGIFLLPPVNFNYKHALPNKFFEFIQARLAIGIGPSPEMAALVEKYDCGLIAPSFDPAALAKMLNDLNVQKINNYKNASNHAAKYLNFNAEIDILNREISKLL